MDDDGCFIFALFATLSRDVAPKLFNVSGIWCNESLQFHDTYIYVVDIRPVYFDDYTCGNLLFLFFFFLLLLLFLDKVGWYSLVNFK